jgi:hypothetical protein
MSKPAVPVVLRYRRGNPDWGQPFRPGPALATQFEVRVRELHLAPETYVFSADLRRWCVENKNRCYVPEWLLKAWGITVDANLLATPLRRPAA